MSLAARRELDVPERAIPAFPGATIEVDGCGQVLGSWRGPAAPALVDSSDLLDALDVDGNSPDAALVQLLLASSVGAPGEAWPVIASGAPAMLHRRSGERLAVSWDAVVDGGAIAAVAVFALALAAPPDERGVPAEANRICVDALALLDDCDGCLHHLAQDPRARAAVHRLYRAMHTIKGSMRGPRLHAIRDLAHEAEAAIEALRGFDEAPGDALAEVAEVVGQLRSAVAAARPRGEVDDAMTDLLRECRPALVDLQLSTVRLGLGEREAAPVASRAIERIRAASERAHMASLRAQCAASARAVEALLRSEMRIPVLLDPGLIDEIEMLDLQLELYASVYREATALEAGPALLAALSSQLGQPADGERSKPEIAAVVAQASLPSLAAAFADADPRAIRCAVALLVDAPAMFEPCHPRDETALRFERAQRELFAAIDELGRREPAADLAALRAIAERLSHVPLTPLAGRLTHMTRTLATELAKSCEAKVELGELAVLPATSRIVGEILLHAVRNALDHGIEPPAVRLAAGKPARGTIDVAAYAVGDRLVVTVRDDGRGVDLERVRRIAVERGLLPAAEAAAADRDALLELLFHPGFSTAATVSLVSGRGIGMDVIRSLAGDLGGSVVMASTSGVGTELTIEIPLAAAPPRE